MRVIIDGRERMVKVLYSVESEHVNIEGKFKLSIFRERKDIQSLLKELKNGRKLFDLFNSNSIANTLLKNLINDELIDANQVVTSKGENYIQDPLFKEIEKGTYSIDFNKICLLDGDYSIITNIKRKISDDKRLLTQYNNRFLVKLNQIVLDNEANDITLFDSIDLYGERGTRVMESNITKSNVNFNIVDQTYKFGDKWLRCGSDLICKVKEKAKDLLLNNPYGEFDLNSLYLIINSIKDFTEKDLINGRLSSYKQSGLTIENFPIIIKDFNQAVEYAYLYAYYNLKNNNYLSFTELDEMFQNEILAKDIFTEKVKKELATFSYSMNGFRERLDKEKYDKLAYKLGILQYLLDIKIENNEFSRAKNYDQITNLFVHQINPDEVNGLFLVMGYPFVKNPRNKLKDAISSLKSKYKDITIVQKGNNQVKDDKIESDIISMGIKTFEIPEIVKSFHDRYIIFSLKNGTYKSFLVTCEFGQFFNLDSREHFGSIIAIDSKELKKDKTDLLKIIRG